MGERHRLRRDEANRGAYRGRHDHLDDSRAHTRAGVLRNHEGASTEERNPGLRAADTVKPQAIIKMTHGWIVPRRGEGASCRYDWHDWRALSHCGFRGNARKRSHIASETLDE